MSGSNFHGLESIQFVSLRPDHLRLVYVSGEDLDAVIRQEFQRLLDSKEAGRTTFEIHRASHIPADPQRGKFRVVVVERWSAPVPTATKGLRNRREGDNSAIIEADQRVSRTLRRETEADLPLFTRLSANEVTSGRN